MKERPILMTAPNVGKIRNNQKTVTRRLQFRADVGDHLWLKEAHYRYGHWEPNGTTATGRDKLRFVGSDTMTTVRYMDDHPLDYVKKFGDLSAGWYLRSPLFMPRWIARQLLEVIHIGTERLHRITSEEIVKEGIVVGSDPGLHLMMGQFGRYHPADYIDGDSSFSDRDTVLRACWAAAWDTINHARASWTSNPVITRIAFKRVAS